MAVYAPHKNFALSASTLSLPNAAVGYYIYAKIPLDEAISTAEVITSTEHLWARHYITYNATTREPEGYILYKLGYISAVGDDGKRTLTSLWTSVKGAGEKGDNGLSAYEIAVENGYVGTKIEWLASLHGEDGEDGQPGADAPDKYYDLADTPAAPPATPERGYAIVTQAGATQKHNHATAFGQDATGPWFTNAASVSYGSELWSSDQAPMTEGLYYRVMVTLTGGTTGSVYLYVDDAVCGTYTTNNAHYYLHRASETKTTNVFVDDGTWDGSVTISVKAITLTKGNGIQLLDSNNSAIANILHYLNEGNEKYVEISGAFFFNIDQKELLTDYFTGKKTTLAGDTNGYVMDFDTVKAKKLANGSIRFENQSGYWICDIDPTSSGNLITPSLLAHVIALPYNENPYEATDYMQIGNVESGMIVFYTPNGSSAVNSAIFGKDGKITIFDELLYSTEGASEIIDILKFRKSLLNAGTLGHVLKLVSDGAGGKTIGFAAESSGGGVPGTETLSGTSATLSWNGTTTAIWELTAASSLTLGTTANYVKRMKITGNYALTLDAGITVVSGEYDGAAVNIIDFVPVDGEVYAYIQNL